MSGAVHQFPSKGPAPRKAEVPEFEVIDPARSKELLGLVRLEIEKIGELIRFMDNHRQESRKLGIESIAIELCALLEGGRLTAVKDELFRADAQRRSARITPEGMDYVHRVEKLLSECDRARTGSQPVKEMNLYRSSLGAPASSGDLIWGPVILFGLVAVGVVVYCVMVPQDRKTSGSVR